MDFYLAMVYGGMAVLAIMMSGYWGVFEKQVLPCMMFAAIGLVLLILGYKTNPYKEDD